MSGADHQMRRLTGCDEGDLRRGCAAKGQEDNVVELVADGLKNRVGEIFPAAFGGPGVGRTLLNGQRGVQQQNPVGGPGREVAMSLAIEGNVRVVGKVVVDVS